MRSFIIILLIVDFEINQSISFSSRCLLISEMLKYLFLFIAINFLISLTWSFQYFFLYWIVIILLFSFDLFLILSLYQFIDLINSLKSCILIQQRNWTISNIGFLCMHPQVLLLIFQLLWSLVQDKYLNPSDCDMYS